MKNWFLIPLAAVVGLVVGVWSSQSDLAALKDAKVVRQARAESSEKGGFGAITQLVNIPARTRASRPPLPPETNSVAVAAASGEAGRRRRHAASRVWRAEDLKDRIEEAKDLWRTRSELAKSQWKAKLEVGGESERRFDETVDAMNADLRDLMGEFADEVERARTITPELGVRMLGAVTRTLSEGYDALGECVDPSARGEISNLPLHEFIDPSVIEPMIRVQDYVEPAGFENGGLVR